MGNLAKEDFARDKFHLFDKWTEGDLPYRGAAGAVAQSRSRGYPRSCSGNHPFGRTAPHTVCCRLWAALKLFESHLVAGRMHLEQRFGAPLATFVRLWIVGRRRPL